MKKFLMVLVMLLAPSIAQADSNSQRNPCYSTNTTTSNCVSVGTSTPLPVTGNTNVATYSASKNFSNSSAGDAYCVYGSTSGKIVKVKGIRITAVASAIAVSNISIVRRSTLNTGGGLTAITAVSSDSNNAASTAQPMYFTSAPTQGTLVGNVRDRYLTISQVATNVVSVSEGLFQFSPYWDQPQVLRSSTEGICVVVPSTAGGTWSIDSEYTEE